MLTFEEKQQIIESFKELTRKEISMGRLNYHFEESQFEKKIVVEKLHPNGNGFVYVGDLLRYPTAQKGLVNIRDFTEQELREVIEDSIMYLSEVDEPIEEEKFEQTWLNRDKAELLLVNDEPYWNIYHGENLEESFGTRDDAEDYLYAEGFKPSAQK